MKRHYVTAFAGRRDSYQVPLALHEHGRLASFVTDGYDAGWVARTLRACGSRRLDRRRCPGLPAERVRAGFALEVGARLLARWMEESRGAVIADQWVARRGADLANASGASAFFYEFQAEEGFRRLRSRDQRRILFHFHPHPRWEHPLLLQEARRFPEFGALIRSHTRADLGPRYAQHTTRAWQLADHVIVASSCTQVSLLAAGCPAERISVVPYGREAIESTTGAAELGAPSRPYVLWVGAGSVRKGLHHLCAAWERSGARALGELVVVARVVDRGMEGWLNRPGIRWVRGLSRPALNWHYRNARAFVLPSLSEGFGQVYLEALAQGCRVIGTRHSVLPDLVAARPWIEFVEPGDIGALAESLARALRAGDPLPAERKAIADSVQEFTWERFRAGVESVLRRFD